MSNPNNVPLQTNSNFHVDTGQITYKADVLNWAKHARTLGAVNPELIQDENARIDFENLRDSFQLAVQAALGLSWLEPKALLNAQQDVAQYLELGR